MTSYVISSTINRTIDAPERWTRSTKDFDTATKIYFNMLQSVHNGESLDAYITLTLVDGTASQGNFKKLASFEGTCHDEDAYDIACEKLGDIIVDEDWDWNSTYSNV